MIGVIRIDGAGRLEGGRFWPVISSMILFVSVVVMFRFGTMDCEFGGGSSAGTG